eukprot:ANDGO_06842.mRNA.1 hypothetical protein
MRSIGLFAALVCVAVLNCSVFRVEAACPATVSQVLSAASQTWGSICFATEATSCPWSLITTSTSTTITAAGVTYTPTGTDSDVSCNPMSYVGAGSRYTCRIQRTTGSIATGDIVVTVTYNSSSTCDTIIAGTVGRVSSSTSTINNLFRGLASASNSQGFSGCTTCTPTNPTGSSSVFGVPIVLAAVFSLLTILIC